MLSAHNHNNVALQPKTRSNFVRSGQHLFLISLVWCVQFARVFPTKLGGQGCGAAGIQCIEAPRMGEIIGKLLGGVLDHKQFQEFSSKKVFDSFEGPTNDCVFVRVCVCV